MPDPVPKLYSGALLGLAVGERSADESFSNDGPTAQALSLGKTLVERRGLAPNELTPKLAPGTAEAAALARLAPVALYLFHDAARAKHIAAESARLTHPSRESIDCCRYFCGLLVGALRGEAKETLLSDLYSPVYNYWLFQRMALDPRVDAVARGDHLGKPAAQLPAGGTPSEVLASALWAFERTSDFESGLNTALELSGATRERGAVYGQLAGVHYGVDAIPQDRLEVIEHRERIESLARELLRGTAQGIRHFTTHGIQGAR